MPKLHQPITMGPCECTSNKREALDERYLSKPKKPKPKTKLDPSKVFVMSKKKAPTRKRKKKK